MCSFHLSVAARRKVLADPSLRYTLAVVQTLSNQEKKISVQPFHHEKNVLADPSLRYTLAVVQTLSDQEKKISVQPSHHDFFVG